MGSRVDEHVSLGQDSAFGEIFTVVEDGVEGDAEPVLPFTVDDAF